jgi:hypothetical protein
MEPGKKHATQLVVSLHGAMSQEFALYQRELRNHRVTRVFTDKSRCDQTSFPTDAS